MNIWTFFVFLLGLAWHVLKYLHFVWILLWLKFMIHHSENRMTQNLGHNWIILNISSLNWKLSSVNKPEFTFNITWNLLCIHWVHIEHVLILHFFNRLHFFFQNRWRSFSIWRVYIFYRVLQQNLEYFFAFTF